MQPAECGESHGCFELDMRCRHCSGTPPRRLGDRYGRVCKADESVPDVTATSRPNRNHSNFGDIGEAIVPSVLDKAILACYPSAVMRPSSEAKYITMAAMMLIACSSANNTTRPSEAAAGASNTNTASKGGVIPGGDGKGGAMALGGAAATTTGLAGASGSSAAVGSAGSGNAQAGSMAVASGGFPASAGSASLSRGAAGSSSVGGSHDTNIGGAQSTGIAVVDRLGAAAQACGEQSDRTVPAGWVQAFDASGCSIEAPSGFQVSGNGTGFVSFVQGEYSAVVGSGVPSLGVPQPADCSPAGVAEYYRAAFESWGCQGAKIVWKQAGAIVVVTDSYPVQQSVFVCDANTAGHPSMGYMFTMGTLSAAGCSMVIRAYGMPETAIEQATCTLSQIINSVKCPTGGSGSCDDAQCRTDCIDQGNAGGACTADGSCYCTN
jgi:hypothetical protein